MFFFIKKIIFFIIPVSIMFAFPAYIIFTAREYFSIENAVQTQESKPSSLFGFGYDDISQIPYKEELVHIHNPTVIALGTSKVMQLRKEFFMQPDKFINAGGAGKSLGDIELFIDDLPKDSNLKVLILGIDQDMLYRPYDSGISRKETSGVLRVLELFATMSRRMYLDYFSHKYTLHDLITDSKTNSNIGLPAIIYDNGFRGDGSYKYGQAAQDVHLLDHVNSEVAARVKQISSFPVYETGNEEDTQLEINLAAIARIIDSCKKRGVIVIGFMPPYPEPIYQALKHSEGLSYKTVTVTPGRIREIFNSKGGSFFDFSSPVEFKKGDISFVDSVHITDASQLRIFADIVEHTKLLDPFIKKSSIEDMTKKEKGDFLSF